MGTMEFRCILDRRQLQHQYVDDLIVNGRRRPFMVAIMAVCLVWILHRRMLRLSDRAYRRNVPH